MSAQEANKQQHTIAVVVLFCCCCCACVCVCNDGKHMLPMAQSPDG